MNDGKKNALALAAILGGILLTAGCASDARHQWLTFFFDGVPAPGGETNVVVTAAPSEPPAALAAKPVAPAPPPDTSSVHPPFQEQKCAECHQSSSGMGLRLQLPQLCFTCHKDFMADNKVKHQPVDNGECLSCHDPHKSENKKLLLQKGNALCLTCHDDPLA